MPRHSYLKEFILLNSMIAASFLGATVALPSLDVIGMDTATFSDADKNFITVVFGLATGYLAYHLIQHAESNNTFSTARPMSTTEELQQALHRAAP